MKRTFIFFLITISLSTQAQDKEERLFALTTSASTLGAGMVKIADPYLSPFEYNGMQIRFQNSTRRFFKPENNKLSYTQKGLLDGGLAHHPSKKNSMLFFNLNYSFGINYHLRPTDKVMILVGSNWDLDVGGKYLVRNVNNPFSLDLYTNLNATAEIQYPFRLLKQDFAVRYGAQTPLLGCMFVPMQGISYYELFMLKNLSTAFHFSSLHNRRGWSHYLSLDIPLSFSTIQLNVQHDYLKYTANGLVFRKNGLIFSAGTVVDLRVFSGKKRKYPANFIRSYE